MPCRRARDAYRRYAIELVRDSLTAFVSVSDQSPCNRARGGRRPPFAAIYLGRRLLSHLTRSAADSAGRQGDARSGHSRFGKLGVLDKKHSPDAQPERQPFLYRSI